MFSRRNADDVAVEVFDVAAKDAVVKSGGFIVELDVVLAETTGTVVEAVVASGVGGGTCQSPQSVLVFFARSSDESVQHFAKAFFAHQKAVSAGNDQE
uniref:B2-adapt-app_C domain-containing protein n=1 Tax=Globodera pallida TaxID=36090 RepID=A0A183CBB7_GLOPA